MDMTKTQPDAITIFENALARQMMGAGDALGITGASRLIAKGVLDQGFLPPHIFADLVSNIAQEQTLNLDAAVEVCANEIYAAIEKTGVLK